VIGVDNPDRNWVLPKECVGHCRNLAATTLGRFVRMIRANRTIRMIRSIRSFSRVRMSDGELFDAV
jgi:hypothetical protein